MSREYNFDEGNNKATFLGRNRRKNKKSNPYQTPMSTGAGVGTTYQLDPSTSMDNTEDGSVSLTYSVSSSQAGESTDSSIADLGVLLQMEAEQKHHVMQQQQAQRQRNSSLRRNFSREKSNCDSLGYSDDDESVNYANWTTITGSQPSDSHAHDGGIIYKSGPTPRNCTSKKGSTFSPVSTTADLNSCTGSNGTPSTPPPRHSKKMSAHDTEVWYQKWWMCGFTDALNLNPKCLD